VINREGEEKDPIIKLEVDSSNSIIYLEGGNGYEYE